MLWGNGMNYIILHLVTKEIVSSFLNVNEKNSFKGGKRMASAVPTLMSTCRGTLHMSLLKGGKINVPADISLN